MNKIHVNDTDITIIAEASGDYLNLTEMVSWHDDGPKLIERWLNNKSTVDFLGVWEQMYNPNFKTPEFRGFRENVGSGGFYISVKKWIESTGAIGIKAKAGRGGGTTAHTDIAFEFGTSVSPVFKLLLITEYQKLKKEEADRLSTGWDARRFLAKTNYTIHTDAIKEYIVPELTEEQAKFAYPNEADLLNVALFGLTAKEWKNKNPNETLSGLNMRDMADIHQLIVLSNLENNNAYLISEGMSKQKRLVELRKIATLQLKSLRGSSYTIEKIQSPFKITSKTFIKLENKIRSGDTDFDTKLSAALKKGTPPKK